LLTGRGIEWPSFVERLWDWMAKLLLTCRGIEWPNFVESPNKWAENNLYNVGIGAYGRA
jgi:hypothetical protein